MTPDGEQHLETLKRLLPTVTNAINAFTLETFRCRGGRLGSGMGNLIEALWGFYMRKALDETHPGTYDIAWITDHAYNDFALLDGTKVWDPPTHDGEVFRIEAKSMNLGADETKGHFDVLASGVGEDDQLLVIVWKWAPVEAGVVYPQIMDQFLGPALAVIELRDVLHIARGGSFVDSSACPDGCVPSACPHDGEPLNASGVRERRSGPNATRGASVSYAANFGGLKRMLATRGKEAKAALGDEVARNPVAAEYAAFVSSFPHL